MGNCLQCLHSSSEQTCSPTSAVAQNNQMTNIDARTTVAFDRTVYCPRPGETDELLASSPLSYSSNLKTTSGDTKLSSFKNSIVRYNGHANVMGDIITTVKEPHEVSDNTLNLFFEEYKDDNDAILSEGIERICMDLGYQPDAFPILVLAWRLDASQMCRFTKTEFIEGLQKMKADSIDTIRIRLEQTIETLKTDSEMFKQLYRFTFRFGLEPDHRILTLEMAIILWRLVFTVSKPDLLDRWLYFLDQHPSIRGIPKDTWNMFLNFSEQCDINNYDDTEAWPSLFDDFVDYEKSRLNSTTDCSSSSNCVDHTMNINNNNNNSKEAPSGRDIL